MKRFAIGTIALLGMGLSAYLFILPHIGRMPVRTMDPGISGDATRGAYIATAAGCYACHTNTKGKGQPFAGGRPFNTPFGTVYSSNITPDRDAGIGGWTVQDFKAALTAGVSPEGQHYFPVFPYTSYVHLRDQDIADLKSYFDTVAPASRPNRAAEMPWPFADRAFVGTWKWLYAPRRDVSKLVDETGKISRGAYLVEVLGHCGECHTQRNALGGYTGKSLGGNTNGPDGGKVPGLRGLSGKWTADEIVSYLSDGMTPDGDFVGGEMSHVIHHSTGKLTQADRQAIANHLLQLRK